MTRRNIALAAAAVGVILATATKPAPAQADVVTFAYGSLSGNATDAQIQTYMNTQLGANGSVTLTGAAGSNSYNADGHVTGVQPDFNVAARARDQTVRWIQSIRGDDRFVCEVLLSRRDDPVLYGECTNDVVAARRVLA